jgi:3-oxo-5-alpha-steroid 4-dehydrogenase 3
VDERAGRRRRRATEGYGIPRGGWFERVSCPHYLAECVLYLGLCVAHASDDATRTRSALAMLLAVFANLALAARRNHAWYLKNMPEYPRDRWAMVPYVL